MATVNEGKIRIKAMCLFRKDENILVSKGFDKIKKEHFYRLLGGSINFFETGEAGVRREIQEELNSEIENLELLDVIENLFIYEGEKAHEIVFLYSGVLSHKELYRQNPIHIFEDTYEFDAAWISMNEIFNGKIPLYPALDYKKYFKN